MAGSTFGEAVMLATVIVEASYDVAAVDEMLLKSGIADLLR